jgi:hypothetical protein
MKNVRRRIAGWLTRRAGLSPSTDLRPYGLHPREWTGKLQSRRTLAPRDEPDNRSVQNLRRDLQEH